LSHHSGLRRVTGSGCAHTGRSAEGLSLTPEPGQSRCERIRRAGLVLRGDPEKGL